jgi:hypothetical protein
MPSFANVISAYSHPLHISRANDYLKWRTVYEGGDDFLEYYLKQFSNREDADDYARRKSLTPIPSFAKSAIKDVRNSIFQRMAGVSRSGGSASYRAAVRGEGFGVDRRGSSMTGWIGKKILDELLVMGGVGVYVDAPAMVNPTLLGVEQFSPYVYHYPVEDIINWVQNDPENPSEFQKLVLRETYEIYGGDFAMPTKHGTRYRRVWINEETGLVNVQFEEMDGELSDIVELQLTKIPFSFLSINDSLIKDVSNHQIALLNLWSSNVYYAVQSGFPIYTEQRDSRDAGLHLKHAANADGTATAGGQGANEREIEVGVARGRSYDMGADRPDFINPSSEPLVASMDLCDRLKKDIRELINLAVVNLGVQASAESKNMDNSGLEAGLSYIGLVLEQGERDIAKYWSAYERTNEIATVAYPERWSLKTDQERIKDATDLHAVVNKLPTRQGKRETTKLLVSALLGNKLPSSVIETIHAEIDQANFTTSDPDIIEMAKREGMLSAETGAVALGFDSEEAERAADEHVERLREIAQHQTTGIQGVRDTQVNPDDENRETQESDDEEDDYEEDDE